jgi:hypothetical protein
VNENGPSRLFFAEKGRLSRYSRFFAAMFGHGWREQRLSSDGKPVSLTEVSADVFHSLLHFMYTQHLVPPSLGLNPLAQFWLLQHYARYYQILGLEDAASSFVAESLSPSTVFLVWEDAIDTESRKLAKACLRYFVRNFAECSCKVEFLSCPPDFMYDALRSGDIEMSSEALMAALHMWGKVTLNKSEIDSNSLTLREFLEAYLPPKVLFNLEHKRHVLGHRSTFYR